MPKVEELDEIQIHLCYPDHKTQIGADLDPVLRTELVDFLKKHHDCFAWSHEDVTRIDLKLMTHELHVDPVYPYVKQKMRKFTP